MRLIITLVCLLPALLAAEAYRYVDPKTGEVVFTDKPPVRQQADKIEIQQPLISTPYQAPATDNQRTSEQSEGEEEAITASLSILSPQSDETIRSNAGTVEIAVSLTNAEQLKQFTIRYILDGETAVESPQLTATLDNVDRGTHSIGAELISRNGKVLAHAEPRTFHLQRVSIRRAN